MDGGDKGNMGDKMDLQLLWLVHVSLMHTHVAKWRGLRSGDFGSDGGEHLTCGMRRSGLHIQFASSLRSYVDSQTQLATPPGHHAQVLPNTINDTINSN
ncbi:hypothetical protein RJT34_09353 [Clitoria ternatea]|uniref:Uncharacterized protein n=1 Tax=Clitoria ternatea TaxID=43366 RepID=A0AAN9K4V0_CLITE